jgi:hypothetical protein
MGVESHFDCLFGDGDGDVQFAEMDIYERRIEQLNTLGFSDHRH